MQSKLPSVETSIFTKVSLLASKHNAINLGQGFPDFEPDNDLLDCVNDAIKGKNHQYAPMAGLVKLRETLGQQHDLTTNLYEDQITITAGGTQAIYTSISAFIGIGDEVIVIEPVYDCYIPAIEVNGGKAVIISTFPPSFEIDWSYVKSVITTKTKMIIINTPNNPTGKMWEEKDFEKLASVLDGTSILVLSDEVYEDISFGLIPHICPLKIDSLRDRTISVHSLGKVLGCTGWKIGYVIANERLTKEFRKVHQFNVFSVNSFVQEAIFSYFERKPEIRSDLRQFYKSKYELMCQLFDSNLEALPVEGGLFQLFNYERYSLEDDVKFNDEMIIKGGVAGIPLSAFYPSGALKSTYIRFCFAKKEDTLIKASMTLNKLLIR